ncbi:DUF1963 domain-containing protein [Paenibacillus yanchengensis]|uniref:DUF1963 domain-containing protein n=1 Tax=Paenibacillus yanchengensis TaxID=2035833 RepID=A0ABW4YN29_9BACL
MSSDNTSSNWFKVLIRIAQRIGFENFNYSTKNQQTSFMIYPSILQIRRDTIVKNKYYLDDEDASSDDYEDFLDAVHESIQGNHDVLQMFSYPDGQHDDAEYEAALMLLTGKEYDYSMENALQKITAALNGDQSKAKQEISYILLLLQLDSDNDIGFCWWDAGALQFYVRKEDLLAQKFDRTYCSLYSS